MTTGAEHRLTVSQVEALLGRRARLQTSFAARRFLAGRRVLVTGAGGSIGGELVRQIAAAKPAALFMLDSDESLMHAVQLEVFGEGQLDQERTVLADIRDGRRLRTLFAELRPDVVFHAAALKHLTMLERYPAEGVRTNTIGTANVLEASRAAGASHVVLISTDKAAEPTSVLGASKRLAELLVRDGSDGSMRTACVRFGNVLGSRGSFLHTLARQIEQGRPVTLTHPDVNRYFMSIPEAAGLVIEAATMAQGGEIYVLDMGEPVRLLDLIERYADLRGLSMPDLLVTGLRPGEKLAEVLVDPAEAWEPSSHDQIWRVDAHGGALDAGALLRLFSAAEAGDDHAVLAALLDCGSGLKAPQQSYPGLSPQGERAPAFAFA